MEFALPELLNREDIIKILNQRQLDVKNMNDLTLDELLRVYKTFAMPLSRRPEWSKKKNEANYQPSTVKNRDNEEQNMQIECSDSTCKAMDIDFDFADSCNAEQLGSTGRTASPAGEKRRQRSIDEDIFEMFNDDYQYQLSSVTKRIRINSLS